MEEAGEIIAPVIQVAEPEKRKGESTRTTWKYRITDINKLDRQYMVPNDKTQKVIIMRHNHSVFSLGIRQLCFIIAAEQASLDCSGEIYPMTLQGSSDNGIDILV